MYVDFFWKMVKEKGVKGVFLQTNLLTYKGAVYNEKL